LAKVWANSICSDAGQLKTENVFAKAVRKAVSIPVYVSRFEVFKEVASGDYASAQANQVLTAHLAINQLEAIFLQPQG
jgi:hypothetical protein